MFEVWGICLLGPCFQEWVRFNFLELQGKLADGGVCGGGSYLEKAKHAFADGVHGAVMGCKVLTAFFEYLQWRELGVLQEERD